MPRRRVTAVARWLWISFAATLIAAVRNVLALAGMSVHVGALFLAWVAILGLSLYELIGGLATLDPQAVTARFAQASSRTAGWFLIVVATVFAGLWLTNIIPALLSGQVPEGARQLGLPSSPVHVLDLAFFRPVTFAAGTVLLRRWDGPASPPDVGVRDRPRAAGLPGPHRYADHADPVRCQRARRRAHLRHDEPRGGAITISALGLALVAAGLGHARGAHQ